MSSFIAINVHVARNPLQIDLHLVILLPQLFYSRSCLIGIVLASSDFSTFQSFEISMLVIESRFFLHRLFHKKSIFSFFNGSGTIGSNTLSLRDALLEP